MKQAFGFEKKYLYLHPLINLVEHCYYRFTPTFPILISILFTLQLHVLQAKLCCYLPLQQLSF